MKKLLLFFTVAAVALTTGCSVKSDGGYVSDYVYVNESSSQITVTINSDMEYDSVGMEDYSQFVIPIDGQYIISSEGLGYPLPFWWVGYHKNEYVAISNGEKTVTQTPNSDELFLIDSYTFISEKGRCKTVKFIFTDDFFKNGEPVE